MFIDGAICSFSRTSNGVTEFTREVRTDDLIQMASEIPDDSIVYNKREESVFIGTILQKSRGMLRIRVDLGHSNGEEQELPVNDDTSTFDQSFDFGKEFEANGTYLIEKIYCKHQTRRNVIFEDLAASDVEKEGLLAVINLS